jgi:hypothetical protein
MMANLVRGMDRSVHLPFPDIAPFDLGPQISSKEGLEHEPVWCVHFRL